MIPAKKKWAEAIANGDFICLETYSGLGRIGLDPQGAQHLLSVDTDSVSLGKAVLDALSHSRTLTLEEYGDFFNFEKRKDNYKKWTADLMDRYGYKSKRKLFENMKNCSIKLNDDILTIGPTRHERLEGWGREKDDNFEDVIISLSNSSTEEIGEALRLAFSRCL